MNIAPDGLGYMQDCNADRVKKRKVPEWICTYHIFKDEELFSQGYLPRHLLNVSTISFAS